MDPNSRIPNPKAHVALLTGGADKPYVFGLATSLMSQNVVLDVIGSDDLDFPEFHDQPRVNFLNLRGSHRPDAAFVRKISRVLMYYARLIRYAFTSKPRIFHILWNNKFEFFDRTVLMLYYRFLGKTIVLTSHNVNAGTRDRNDTRLNRFSLRIQYQLADHLFVHTEKMKLELIDAFGMPPARITVVPFGINNAVRNTGLAPAEARRRLGIREPEKIILFFGNITPYKGLEYLITAFHQLLGRRDDCRLVIAGKPDRFESYWRSIAESTREGVQSGRILLRPEFIPDDETEVYFKAADVLVLPYRHIYQSGVLFLGYSFGLPALVADVGALKDEIVEGKTGFVFRPDDAADLTRTIEKYFASDLYAEREARREEIRDYAMQRHTWAVVAQMTMGVYGSLCEAPSSAAAEGTPSVR